ncbi:hypothetical protein G3I13_19650 [Streptomyces sp. SID6673]|nr:hypothetical protein [Streptomyces sp. SID11726]NEB26553.1 hypothetical protein [Streptomyces sp. SID6673]
MNRHHHARILATAMLTPLAALTLVNAPASAAEAGPPLTVVNTDEPTMSPAPGAIVTTFAGNQLKYCALICPHIIDFVVDVPVAVVRSPGVFAAAQEQTGSADRATGIAAASITRPANSAMTGIIDNDLNLVLPRAQNALEVAVVEGLTVADTVRSGAPPGAVGKAVDTGRAKIVDALNAPIVANPPQIATPTTPAQAATLDAIDVGSAVLFQAPELVMVGATEAAVVAAQHLATTGDTGGARAVGVAHLNETITHANDVIRQATTNHHVPEPLS